MPALHQRNFLQKLRVLWVFIEFNILIFTMICRQKRTHLNLGPGPAIQPAPQPLPQQAPKEKKKATKWVMSWILQRQGKGCYTNLLANLIHTDIPGYQNFGGMPPTFFDLMRNPLTTSPRSQSPISGSP